MNVTETKRTPETPPLPVSGSSINPEWVLYRLQKFENRLSRNPNVKKLAARGKLSFESLIWDGNSDLSSRRQWAAFKYWVEGFDSAQVMALEACYVAGRSNYIDVKYYEWIEEWMDASIRTLIRFIREYPGEQMRRVDLKERAALGIAFELGTLRVDGAKDFTTGARINVDEEIDDEDWVDVGDDGNGSDRTNEDGMDIQNQWVFVIKGQII